MSGRLLRMQASHLKQVDIAIFKGDSKGSDFQRLLLYVHRF